MLKPWWLPLCGRPCRRRRDYLSVKYPDTPVLCNVCRKDPALQGLVVAGMIRDDELPPRCPLCGFRVGPDGARVPEG
jgi:hypothetical protein